MCCIMRLTTVMPTQQQKPIKMGLPPVLISFTILVLRPMAHMDSTMKNLLKVAIPMFKATVVITEASTK